MCKKIFLVHFCLKIENQLIQTLLYSRCKFSKFDKMATSKGDENSSAIPSESTVNEDSVDGLDVSFNRATSIFDQDHLPIEDADDR